MVVYLSELVLYTITFVGRISHANPTYKPSFSIHNASETDIVISKCWRMCYSVGASQVESHGIPSTTPYGFCIFTLCIIGAPFGKAACHIQHTVGTCPIWKTADRRQLFVVWKIVEFREVEFIAPRIKAGISASGSLFPFRFCRQAFSYPFGVGGCLIPTHTNNRMVWCCGDVTFLPKPSGLSIRYFFFAG